MTVEPTLYPIPFKGGLDTKSDPLQVLAGSLLELENGVFTKAGQISKRYGYDILGRNVEGGGTITAAKAIGAFRDELVLFDGKRVYSFIEATGTWAPRGTAISVIADTRKVVTTPSDQQLNPDVGYLDGIEVYAWEDDRDGGSVRYSVIDAETRAFVVSDVFIGTGAKPKVMAFGGKIHVFWTDGLATLFYRSVNPANPGLITPTGRVFSDGYASGFDYDMCVIGSKLFVAYHSGNGPSNTAIQLSAFDTSLALLGTVVVEDNPVDVYDGTKANCLTICGSAAQEAWLIWSNGTTFRQARYSYTLVAVVPSMSIAGTSNTDARVTMIEQPGSPGVAQVAVDIEYNHSADVAHRHIVSILTVDAAGTFALTGFVTSVGIASKFFQVGSDLYLNLAYESPLQSTYFTVLVDGPLGCPIIAKTSQGVGGGLRTSGLLSEVVTTPSGQLWANLQKGKPNSEANTVFALLGVTATTFDFTHPNKYLSATASGNLLVVGGILQSYDGVSLTEHGFHLFPEGLGATATGSDGHLGDGTYQYCAVYRWTDNLGLIQRSAPSTPVSVECTADNHVSVTIPRLYLTAKQPARGRSNVVIDVYRTQANGTVFNRVSSVLAPEENVVNFNTTPHTFLDTMSDADAAANEELYTTGGVLENIAPPANSLMSLYQNRVMLAGLEDPNLIWFSKNRFDNTNFNTIPVEFSDSNVIGCDPRGGDITALFALDDKQVIFKREALFVVSGDGPNDAGGGDVFPDPQLITADVGCSNPNSVVMTPMGLMFQSLKGIYLLDRSLSASYIGSPVEVYNDKEITSATLDADANLVIFTTTSGPALVYDYFYQQWSTWTNHDAEDSDSFGGSFCFVKSNGKVYQQDKTKFTDGDSKVLLSWTTPNLTFAGIAGYQRAFRAFILGSYKGTHSLRVRVAYDYSPSYTQEATIDASVGVSTWGSSATWGSDPLWGGTYKPYEYRIDFKQQRCTAIRLKVTDEQTSDYNEGYAISALTFEVGAMRRGTRVPATRTVGTA